MRKLGCKRVTKPIVHCIGGGHRKEPGEFPTSGGEQNHAARETGDSQAVSTSLQECQCALSRFLGMFRGASERIMVLTCVVEHIQHAHQTSPGTE